MSEPPAITILFLGDDGAGKSTFLSRISKGPSGLSSSDPIPLLRDGDQPFVFEVQAKTGPFRLELYDTNSPENWQLLRPDVVVLCYDISSRSTLTNVQDKWSKLTHGVFGERTDLPILLLGLKRDLRNGADRSRIVVPQEAYGVAQQLRCDKYMECSAQTGELLHEAFEDICRTAIMTSTAEGGLSKGGCCTM